MKSSITLNAPKYRAALRCLGMPMLSRPSLIVAQPMRAVDAVDGPKSVVLLCWHRTGMLPTVSMTIEHAKEKAGISEVSFLHMEKTGA